MFKKIKNSTPLRRGLRGAICLILIVVLLSFNVFAEEYTTVYPSTGTGFLKTYDSNNLSVLANTTGVPTSRGVNPKVYYLFNHSASSSRDMVLTSFCLNINPKYVFKKGREYTIEFDIVVPTVYLEDLYIMRGGFYNWASVNFSNPLKDTNFTYINSGCFYDFTNSNATNSNNWEVLTGVMPNHSAYTVKYTFNPASDITFASLYYVVGISLDHIQAYFGCSAPRISYLYNGEYYEEESAKTDGDKNVGEALDVLPNDSTKFVNSLENLANAVSYNGTDAILNIPAMSIPALTGMGNAIKLTDSIEFDLGSYINYIPSNILNLVRILLTIALIVFCFKELYSIIQMVMINRGSEE